MARLVICHECSKKFMAQRPTAKFCGNECRRDWNNRRAIRGAELYDLVMASRFERAKAQDEKLWSLVCSLASAYKASDDHLRPGRKSYDAEAAVTRVPIAFSHAGDKR